MRTWSSPAVAKKGWVNPRSYSSRRRTHPTEPESPLRVLWRLQTPDVVLWYIHLLLHTRKIEDALACRAERRALEQDNALMRRARLRARIWYRAFLRSSLKCAVHGGRPHSLTARKEHNVLAYFRRFGPGFSSDNAGDGPSRTDYDDLLACHDAINRLNLFTGTELLLPSMEEFLLDREEYSRRYGLHVPAMTWKPMEMLGRDEFDLGLGSPSSVKSHISAG